MGVARSVLWGSFVVALAAVSACADESPNEAEVESLVVTGATNVSLTGTVFASPALAGYPATNAKDGNATTAWIGAQTSCGRYDGEDCPGRAFLPPVWLKIELATPQTLDELSVRVAGTRRLELQYCPPNVACNDDGTNWLTPAGGSFWITASSAYRRVFLYPPVQAAAIRVVISESYNYVQRASVFELEGWTYPPNWNNGSMDCNVTCNTNTTDFSVECRHETAFTHTTCGEYGIYKDSCASWCGGYLLRNCSSPCVAPDGSSSTCGETVQATGASCVTDATHDIIIPVCSDICTMQSSYHYTVCRETATSTTNVSCGPNHPYAPPEAIKGYVAADYSGGADFNRCVINAPTQFATLPDNDSAGTGAITYDSNAMGFTPSCYAHWQSIQRMPNDPTRFVMTASNEGYIYGRIARGTIPGSEMGIVGAQQPIINQIQLSLLDHPGGTQMIGNYLFVGEEVYNSFTSDAYYHIFDTANGGFTQVSGNYNLGPGGAGAVAVTKLQPMKGEPGSRYLMIVLRQDGAKQIHFYLTAPGVSLAVAQNHFYYTGMLNMWVMDTHGDYYGQGWMSFQNINMITECWGGYLYLVGLGRTDGSCTWEGGSDWAKLYGLTSVIKFDPVTASDGREKLTINMLNLPSSEKHLYLSGRVNLAAAGGTYVTPSNQLNLLGTEHKKTSSFGNGIDLSEITPP